MDRSKLKEILLSIKENEYEVPENTNAFELSLTMMDYIGDLDGEFRDDFIYLTLAHFIVEDKLTKDEVKKILNMLLSEDYLFYKIGKVEDSVFTRTFSLLQLPIILYKHIEDNFLEKEEVLLILDKVSEYFNKEKDLRGYVKEKGWAHSIAHGADVLGQLAKCKEVGEDELMKILDIIKSRIQINNYVYINEEDERMVEAIMNLLERDLIDKKEIINWINEFSDYKKVGSFPEDLNINLNSKNFLRSLYFKLYDNKKYKEIVESIENTLEEVKKIKM